MIITALGYPFVFGYNAVCGILRGMGESKRPLYFISVAALINIGLDIFFVAVLGMQADGTAIATTLSQVGSFVASFRYLWKNREKFEFELSKEFFWPDAKILETIVVLGVPQVVRSLLVRFSLLWINANINSYGLTVSATNSIGNKIQKFSDVFNSGVDTASAAMIGQNLGANKKERAGKVCWATLSLGLGLCLLNRGSAAVLPAGCVPHLHYGRSSHRYGQGISAHYGRAFLCFCLCRRVPGYGHRLRLCLARLCDRHSGRCCLQDRSEPVVRQRYGHGLCRLLYGHCFLAHFAGHPLALPTTCASSGKQGSCCQIKTLYNKKALRSLL